MVMAVSTPAEEMTQVVDRSASAPTAEDAEIVPAKARRAAADRPEPDDAPAEDEPSAARGVDEAQERTILLGKVKAVADKLKYDAKTRAALWTEHVGSGDPRTAPVEALADLYAHLRALAGESA